jgi:hypothetical protein
MGGRNEGKTRNKRTKKIKLNIIKNRKEKLRGKGK